MDEKPQAVSNLSAAVERRTFCAVFLSLSPSFSQSDSPLSTSFTWQFPHQLVPVSIGFGRLHFKPNPLRSSLQLLPTVANGHFLYAAAGPVRAALSEARAERLRWMTPGKRLLDKNQEERRRVKQATGWRGGKEQTTQRLVGGELPLGGWASWGVSWKSSNFLWEGRKAGGRVPGDQHSRAQLSEISSRCSSC